MSKKHFCVLCLRDGCHDTMASQRRQNSYPARRDILDLAVRLRRRLSRSRASPVTADERGAALAVTRALECLQTDRVGRPLRGHPAATGNNYRRHCAYIRAATAALHRWLISFARTRVRSRLPPTSACMHVKS